MNKIRIGIVEDQKLFRDGLIAIMEGEPEFDMVLEAESADQLFEKLKQSEALPHILLLDMSLPDVNGIEINDIIHKEFPHLKTIILTAYDQPRYIVRLIEKGANSFLSKNIDVDELILAIKSVHHTGFYFNKVILYALQQETGKKKSSITSVNGIPVELTNREMEILLLICKEFTTEEIAQQLFVSTRTVDGHRLNLLDKTGCKNIAGLVIFAIANNFFIPLK
jgi:DNA-binding NarL/FixJ family response regulator